MHRRFVWVCFLAGAIAAIVPIIPCTAAPATPPAVALATIDWSQGDAQDTTADCGQIAFKNIQDKHSYILYVRGKNSGFCSFQSDGLTFHLPPNYGPTTTGRATIFNFIRFGSDVVVSWQPDY